MAKKITSSSDSHVEETLESMLDDAELQKLTKKPAKKKATKVKEVDVDVELPAAKKPKRKAPVKKRKDEETLDDFLRAEQYKQTKEYQEEQEFEESLQDKSNVNNILDIAKLDNLEDLSTVTILDEDRTADINDNLSFLLNAKSTYQVVLNQSAYIAHVEGLRLKEVFALANSVGDDYHSALKRYQTYHSVINTTSINISDFNEWAKYTSLYDIPTIEFGIFNQTFPGDTEFDITCSHCQEKMKNVKISNDQLIVVKDDAAYEQLDRVIHSINDQESCKKHSLINKFDRFQLPLSKAIVEIRIPTIQDQLDILVQLNSANLAKVKEYLDILYFVKDIMIVDLKATQEQGKPVFNKLSNRNQILRFLQHMGLDDVSKLNREIEGKDTKYRVDYAIKSFKCRNQKCGKETGDISIDIQKLLFEQAALKVLQ